MFGCVCITCFEMDSFFSPFTSYHRIGIVCNMSYCGTEDNQSVMFYFHPCNSWVCSRCKEKITKQLKEGKDNFNKCSMKICTQHHKQTNSASKIDSSQPNSTVPIVEEQKGNKYNQLLDYEIVFSV